MPSCFIPTQGMKKVWTNWSVVFASQCLNRLALNPFWYAGIKQTLQCKYIQKPYLLKCKYHKQFKPPFVCSCYMCMVCMAKYGLWCINRQRCGFSFKQTKREFNFSGRKKENIDLQLHEVHMTSNEKFEPGICGSQNCDLDLVVLSLTLCERRWLWVVCS